MTLTEEDKEFLAHYGVPGMKWGVRRSQEELDRDAGRAEGIAEAKKRKAADKEENKTISRSDRKLKDQETIKARSRTRARQINMARLTQAVKKAKTPSDKETAYEKLIEHYNEYVEHPDTLNQARVTRGEEVTNGIIYAASGLTMAAALGIAFRMK